MDIGEALRTAREQRGLSLETISQKTKIGVAALRAIEGNDVQHLPGGIFLRGFVRAYAREVGLDVEDTVNRYVAQFESQPVMADGAAVDADTLDSSVENREARSLDVREVSVLGLVAIVVLSVGLLAYMTLRPTRTTSEARVVPAAATPVATAPATPADPALAPPVDPALAPPVDPALAPPVDPAPATPAAPAPATPAAPAPATPAALAPATPTTLAPATPAAQALSQVVPTSTPGETGTAGAREPGESPATPVQAGNALRLTIETIGPCWVSATVDGETVVYRLMQEGERQSIPDGNDVVLRIGDPAAFTFSVNGAQGRSLGPAGTAATVHITPDNYREFVAGASAAP